MKPEHYMEVLEATHFATEYMDRVKTALEYRGWTVEGAESAAENAYVTMLMAATQ